MITLDLFESKPNKKLNENVQLGNAIKALYQKIHAQGDDAVEFMYYDSPIFAQYWDEYEGDLDSIIAEVDPQELQIILDELEAAAADQGIAEAVGLDRSKVPNYPRDPATIQHRIDTAKAILSDPKSDADSRQAAAAILAKHKGVAEGSIGTYILNVMDEATGEHWAIEIQATSPEMAKERARQQGYKVLRIKEKGVAKQPVNEISPHDYDSDEDYYAALRGRRKPSYNDDSDFDPELDRPQDDGDDESYYEKYVRTKGLEEANKKKEAEPEVRDVGLQRAISKSKAEFPTAQSGVQALMKKFQQDQEKDQDEFAKVRRADRRQDQLLAQISQVDKEQEQELQDLDKQNSTLSQRLQQLQSVNDKLQQTLATMSGRKEKPKAEKPADTKPANKPSINITTPASQPVSAQPKKEKTPSSMAATAKQLSAPKKADPMAAMAQRIQQGDQSITDKITGQKSLAFEPTDNVIVPKLQKKKYEPAADITDVEPKYYADLTSKIAKQAITDPETAAQTYSVHENDEEEADYGDEYQDMVARVGQKAKQQEKDKPVDIADLARRLAAIETSKKK